MKKIIKRRIRISTRTRDFVDYINHEFYSHDKHNAFFEFTMEQLPTENIIGLFYFQKTKRYLEKRATVDGNTFTIEFDTSLINTDETVIGFIYFEKVVESADVHQFSFGVKVSEIDKMQDVPIQEESTKRIVSLEDIVTKAELKELFKTIERNSESTPIDTSNFATVKSVEAIDERVIELEKRPAIDSLPIPLYKEYTLDDFNEYAKQDYGSFLFSNTRLRGKVFFNPSYAYTKISPLVYIGDGLNSKTAEYDAILYTAASSLPDRYSLESINNDINNKVIFLSNKNFSEVVPKEELKAIVETEFAKNDSDIKQRLTDLESRPTGGGSQTQDTGWITISDDNPLHGNVVKIRRINDMVHVSLSNPNNEGLQFELDNIEFAVILANKNIGIGFTPLHKLTIPVTEIENVMKTTTGGTNVIGQVIYKIENGKVMINAFGDKFSTGQRLEVLVNDFSYFTEDPFPRI